VFPKKHCWSDWSYKLFFRSTRKHNPKFKLSVRDMLYEVLGHLCELASK